MWWLLGGGGGAAHISSTPFLCAAAVSVLALLCPIASFPIPAMTHRLVLKERCISAETAVQVNSYTVQQKGVICWLRTVGTSWARQEGLPNHLQPINASCLQLLTVRALLLASSIWRQRQFGCRNLKLQCQLSNSCHLCVCMEFALSKSRVRETHLK